MTKGRKKMSTSVRKTSMRSEKARTMEKAREKVERVDSVALVSTAVARGLA